MPYLPAADDQIFDHGVVGLDAEHRSAPPFTPITAAQGPGAVEDVVQLPPLISSGWAIAGKGWWRWISLLAT